MKHWTPNASSGRTIGTKAGVFRVDNGHIISDVAGEEKKGGFTLLTTDIAIGRKTGLHTVDAYEAIHKK